MIDLKPPGMTQRDWVAKQKADAERLLICAALELDDALKAKALAQARYIAAVNAFIDAIEFLKNQTKTK